MTRRLSRRAFVSRVAALAASPAFVLTPQSAYAQQPVLPRRIGVLLSANSPGSKEAQAFRQGLLNAGYAEGRDVVIELRSANGDYAQVPALVADLVQRKVDVIVVDSTVAARSAKQATSTIPIVMTLIADPIGSGLVANLAHPGGNVTGLSLMLADTTAKRLQLLKETVPRIAHVTVLWNPDTSFHAKVVQDLKAVAPSLSIELKFIAARTQEEIYLAFSAANLAHAQALFVIEDPFFDTQRVTLAKLASEARLPAIYGGRRYVDAGGLMSYTTSFRDLMRRSAEYVDKILKGAKPSDLPIQQPTKFELILNLKTAKALGLTFPESILVRADDVIR